MAHPEQHDGDSGKEGLPLNRKELPTESGCLDRLGLKKRADPDTEMTLVLSMNPLLDSEEDPPPVWDSERCRKTCLSDLDPACSSEQQFTQEPPFRRVPDHVSMSKITYFKRKFVDDDEEPRFSFRSYCQTVSPVLEERAHVLRLSLEKMRFIDDPEAFLRRSVLVNNLLRRLRAEILLQSSDWCFPPNPAFTAGPCILPPAAGPAHRAVPARICLAAPQAGPPLRKRFRMVRGIQGNFRPDCCCIYAAAAAGHYLHLPFSVYDSALSTCPTTPPTSFFQLAGHGKLDLTVAVGNHHEEEEDAEEEEQSEEDDNERRQEGPSVDVEDKVNQKTRTKTLFGHKHLRTEDDGMSGNVEEEDEEEEQVVRLCPWDSETDLHRFSFWHSRAHRQ